MGSWSVKPFGNDTALDWLEELQKSKDGNKFISKTISAILSEYDGCSALAEEAIAAISIVAGSTIDPVKGINQDAKAWINYSGFVPSLSLIERSLLAIEIIKTNSELLDLWRETESLKTWIKDVNKIESVLFDTRKGTELPVRKPKKRVLPRILHKLLEHYDIYPDKKVRDKIFTKIKDIENVNEGGKESNFTLPLVLVSKHGLLEETKYLLNRGASPNTESISWACVNGHTEIAELLLGTGLDIFDNTVMDMNTGYRYNPDIYKDSDEKPNLNTYEYCIALFSVASLGKPKVIDYLVSKGASIHQLDLNGETLIHKACYSKNISTLEHLIKLGVNINASKGIVNSNKNSRGETALHYAVSKGFTEGVRLLLESGANPNITEYFIGRHNWVNTPLDFAKDKCDSETLELIKKFGGLLAEDLEKK